MFDGVQARHSVRGIWCHGGQLHPHREVRRAGELGASAAPCMQPLCWWVLMGADADGGGSWFQVFSVLLSAPLLGTSYPPLAVWASLLPIIGGCAMSSLNEVTFSWPGFLNASASNVGMVLRNIVRWAAYHLCMSALVQLSR